MRAAQVIYLYRDSKQQLDEDLTALGQYLGQFGTIRLNFCLHQFHFQQFPFNAKPLLSKPHDRRQDYLTNRRKEGAEINGLIPLVKNRTQTKLTLPFITRTGGELYTIDLVNRLAHIGIFGDEPQRQERRVGNDL